MISTDLLLLDTVQRDRTRSLRRTPIFAGTAGNLKEVHALCQGGDDCLISW